MSKQKLNSSELLARSEYQEQCKIFEWAELAKSTYPELEMLIGSLNGVRISIGSAVKARKAGLKRGYPDLAMDVMRSRDLGPFREFKWVQQIYCGLRIELKKANGGKISSEQVWWINKLRDQGYRAVICYGADEAINEIKNYLELPRLGANHES